MHQSSIEKMARFRQSYLEGRETEPLNIVDLGSLSLGGNYRDIFNGHAWTYIGVDLSEGENVDLVLGDPYNWLEIPSMSVDVLVSGQAFEHIEFFWRTMREIARVLKSGGLCCIIAPSKGPEHRYPVDCWRFYPDGVRAMARYAGLDVVQAETDWRPGVYRDGSQEWADTLLVAKKPEIKQGIHSTDVAAHIYQGRIDVQDRTPSSIIIGAVRPGTTVLELGPATGYLTEYLTNKLGCTVDCVEISENMADIAGKFARKMVVADLDKPGWDDAFVDTKYDYVIIADVLEHLLHGERVLAESRRLLKTEGRCILSLPNISHASVIGALIKGRFNYSDEGLLDRTHLRFYTRDSIQKLLRASGYHAERIETVDKLPEETEIGISLTEYPLSVQETIFSRKDALVYQFVLVCSHGTRPEETGLWQAEEGGETLIDMRRLHLQGQMQMIEQLQTTLKTMEALVLERGERVTALTKGLGHAEKLAAARQDQIDRLNEGLRHASDLAKQRQVEIDKYRQAFEDAQRIAFSHNEKNLKLNETNKRLSEEIQILKKSGWYKFYQACRKAVKSVKGA